MLYKITANEAKHATVLTGFIKKKIATKMVTIRRNGTWPYLF